MTEREVLAAQQGELLRALLAGGDVPPGFDATRIAVQAHALLHKRRRITAGLRPDLAEYLGERFPALFAEYAHIHPRQAGTSARADAAQFAAWLGKRGVRRRWRPW